MAGERRPCVTTLLAAILTARIDLQTAPTLGFLFQGRTVRCRKDCFASAPSAAVSVMLTMSNVLASVAVTYLVARFEWYSGM